MKTAQFNTHGRHSIHLAFDENTLDTLIHVGKLHAADFNCLNKSSKKTVWNMLLSAAARKLKS
jgi:hypothetical protein